MSLNLRKLQKDVITQMFQIPSGDSTDDSKQAWQSSWKVLIYDTYCQEILAPILHLQELRSMGCTLHLLITNKRERVPDVPAVYFVRPTKDNIDLICADAAANRYDSMYINFTSSIPRTLMEYFAQKQAQHSVIRIQKIYDQYTEFVSLESNLVSLAHKHSYVKLNNPRQPEDKLFSYIDEIVESLFSVIVTMGTVPIIRCRAGEAAEMCASKLNTRLREHLVSRNNLFANTNTNLMTFHRPVLILVDRNLDLSTPLYHSWTYQALVHDLLGMSSNRVDVAVDDEKSKNKKMSYDLNSVEDKFWKHNAGKPFTKVAENIQEKLKQYKTDMDNMGFTGRENLDGMVSDTKGLADALTKLPEMTKKKKYLDMHTNIATGVLKEVKAREIDTFFDLEQQCMNKATLDPKALSAALGSESKGSIRDRQRLLMIYYLCNNLTDAQLKELRDTLEKGIESSFSISSTSSPNDNARIQQQRKQMESDLAALDYLQHFKFVNRIQSDMSAGIGTNKTVTSGRFGDNISAWVGGFGGGLLAGVKNLLPVNTDLPLTKVVDALMKNQDTPETEKYHYFDPKVKTTGPIHKNRMTTPFKDALVFVLGGGSYVEYQNLQDYAVKNSGPTGQLTIAYGSTEMVSPEGFLTQFAELGAAEASTKRAAKAVPVD